MLENDQDNDTIKKLQNIQIGFILFIIGIILIVYVYQISTGASVYSTSGYTDASDFNLLHTSKLKEIYSILLCLTILFPVVGILYKKPLHILGNILISLFLTFLLFQSLQFNRFGGCSDFCGFYTIFLAPFVIIVIGIISSLALYIFNKKTKKVPVSK